MQVQKHTFSQPEWVQSRHWAPRSSPKCPISSKTYCYIYKNTSYVVKLGTECFKLGRNLAGPVWWGGLARGRPYMWHNVTVICGILFLCACHLCMLSVHVKMHAGIKTVAVHVICASCLCMLRCMLV